MYAGDFSDAILYALDNFNSMPLLLNIGTGVDNTIDEYYSIVADLMGYEGKFVYNLNKPVGMSQKLVSINKNKFSRNQTLIIKVNKQFLLMFVILFVTS